MKPADTTDEAWAVQQRVWQRLGGSGRVELAIRMSEEARAISLAGIRSRHPEYSREEARFALFRLLYGDALFQAAWPRAPLLAP